MFYFINIYIIFINKNKFTMSEINLKIHPTVLTQQNFGNY